MTWRRRIDPGDIPRPDPGTQTLAGTMEVFQAQIRFVREQFGSRMTPGERKLMGGIETLAREGGRNAIVAAQSMALLLAARGPSPMALNCMALACNRVGSFLDAARMRDHPASEGCADVETAITFLPINGGASDEVLKMALVSLTATLGASIVALGPAVVVEMIVASAEETARLYRRSPDEKRVQFMNDFTVACSELNMKTEKILDRYYPEWDRD
jgi:hypothetical protein